MIKEIARNLAREIKYLSHLGKEKKKISYSQSGEDLIVDFIFQVLLKKSNIFYLDIGAHHPFYLSNTAKFYKEGFRGICVEPDPALFKVIKSSRPNDVCLNVGVGVNRASEVAKFYIMDPPTLNTFSEEEALKYQNESGHKIVDTINVRLIDINSILENYSEEKIDFVSLDIEGFDLQVLKSFDFKKFRPSVFCIETAAYSNKLIPVKSNEILEIMKENNYLIYADTYINTIFVDKFEWEKSYQV